MTIDKITHYLGSELTQFIGSLKAEQLQKMKKDLKADIELHKKGNTILFIRQIELNYINYLLQEN